MDQVSKTLYIPLYGKALVTKKGLILQDTKAVEIWDKAQFPLKGKAVSKWLAYYMSMRARVFDDWVLDNTDSDTVILHLGCGLDSRVLRTNAPCKCWYDIDLPAVCELRRALYEETDTYRIMAADLRSTDWLQEIPHCGKVIVAMEGISMYLDNDALRNLMAALDEKFAAVRILMDQYTPMAAKASARHNPINQVGVTTVNGIEDPAAIGAGNIRLIGEADMTPQHLIDELPKGERFIFRHLYAGGISKKLYRMCAYGK